MKDNFVKCLIITLFHTTTSVPNYRTFLGKIWVLRKLIIMLNLFLITIVFTILSFKRET